MDERVRVVEALGGRWTTRATKPGRRRRPGRPTSPAAAGVLLLPVTTVAVATGLYLWARRRAPGVRYLAALSVPCTPASILALQQVLATPLHVVRESLTSPFNLAALLPLLRRGLAAGADPRHGRAVRAVVGAAAGAGRRRPRRRPGPALARAGAGRVRRRGCRRRGGGRPHGRIVIVFRKKWPWVVGLLVVLGVGRRGLFAIAAGEGHAHHRRDGAEARPRGDRLGLGQDRSEALGQHQRPGDGPGDADRRPRRRSGHRRPVPAADRPGRGRERGPPRRSRGGRRADRPRAVAGAGAERPGRPRHRPPGAQAAAGAVAGGPDHPRDAREGRGRGPDARERPERPHPGDPDPRGAGAAAGGRAGQQPLQPVAGALRVALRRHRHPPQHRGGRERRRRHHEQRRHGAAHRRRHVGDRGRGRGRRDRRSRWCRSARRRS